MKDKIMDTLREFSYRYELTREAWVRIGITVGISILIAGLIVLASSPGGAIARLDDAISDINNTLGQGPFATEDDLNNIGGQVAFHGSNISWLDTRTCNVENQVALVRADVDHIICSSPDASLDGSFRDYTLYVKSSHSGDYTANVHLVYSPPMAALNATNYTAAVDFFYTSINWTVANYAYIPTVSFSDTTWGVHEVWFNIGSFELTAYIDEVINIRCLGLNITPAYSYVEVHKI